MIASGLVLDKIVEDIIVLNGGFLFVFIVSTVSWPNAVLVFVLILSVLRTTMSNSLLVSVVFSPYSAVRRWLRSVAVVLEGIGERHLFGGRWAEKHPAVARLPQ